jgi:hypothetical protein
MKYTLPITIALVLGLGIGLMLQLPASSLKAGGADYSISGTVTNTAVSISAATSTAVLSFKSGRMYALLSNNSTNTIFCALGEAATANKGVRLTSTTGQFEIMSTKLFQHAINCIATGATSSLSVVER